MSTEKINKIQETEGTAETEEVKLYKKLPLDNNGKLIPYVPRLQSPRNLVIMSFRKSGKTDNMIDLPNFFIGDCEEGCEYFEGANQTSLLTFAQNKEKTLTNYMVLPKSNMIVPTGIYQVVQELRHVNNMAEYEELRRVFVESPSEKSYNKMLECILRMMFPIFVLDTVTSFMNIVEALALFEYNSNLKDPAKRKSNIKRVDEYSGAIYIRKTLQELKSFVERAAPFTLYSAHTKLKKAVLQKGDDEISTIDMDLEGSLPGIFSSKSAALGFLYRDKEGVFIDFAKRVETDLDARPRHLSNQLIKIADLHERDEKGFIIKKGQTYWSKIYPELNWPNESTIKQ